LTVGGIFCDLCQALYATEVKLNEISEKCCGVVPSFSTFTCIVAFKFALTYITDMRLKR